MWLTVEGVAYRTNQGGFEDFFLPTVKALRLGTRFLVETAFSIYDKIYKFFF